MSQEQEAPNETTVLFTVASAGQMFIPREQALKDGLTHVGTVRLPITSGPGGRVVSAPKPMTYDAFV